MKVRLGVNIDHVATLRQAREENYPSLVEAANHVLDAGADQITIHLREDRRHIQDTDVTAVKLVTKKYGKPLNLEMGCAKDIIELAISCAPEWICLVPEKREEKTTEGGLNLKDKEQFEKISETMMELRSKISGVKISLFLESDIDTLELAKELSPDAVEVHTGGFAHSFNEGEDLSDYDNQFFKAKDFLMANKIACHAGHGLTLESTQYLLNKNYFEEYNIGHWIVAQSVFNGLRSTVKQLVEEFKKS